MKNIQHSTIDRERPRLWRSRQLWRLDVSKSLLILAIRGYQLTLSPLLTFLVGAAGGCRYTPTCSAYAMEALREHGAVGGTALAAKRICRCHPWGGCGHDPVPPKNPQAQIRRPETIKLSWTEQES
jgi:putative membrane protein insertion efficiency factor